MIEVDIVVSHWPEISAYIYLYTLYPCVSHIPSFFLALSLLIGADKGFLCNKKESPPRVAPLPLNDKKPVMVDYSCVCASYLNDSSLLRMVSWRV